MDNRFNPYETPGSQQQRQQAQNLRMQAAMGMEEALYIQRQRDLQRNLQRDLQIRQLLLQDQFDQQNLFGGVATSLQQQQQQQRLFELQQYAQSGHQTMAGLRQEEQMILNQQREEQVLLKQQEQLRRFQLQQHQAGQLSQQPNPSVGVPPPTMGGAAGISEYENDVLMPDAQGSFGSRPTVDPASFKRPSPEEIDLSTFKLQIHRNDPISREEFYKREGTLQHFPQYHDGTSGDILPVKPRRNRSKMAQKKRAAKEGQALLNAIADSSDRDAVEGLLQSATEERLGMTPPSWSPSPVEELIKLGTVEGLLEAAAEDQKADNAASLITGLKSVVWPDSDVEEEEEDGEGEGEEEEEEEEEEKESVMSVPAAVVIELPNFKSSIPSLQEEPMFETGTLVKARGPDNDAAAHLHGDAGPFEDAVNINETPKRTSKANSLSSPMAPVEYPYPVDTWWPSITTIRRERRMHGEQSDEDDFPNSSLHPEGSRFRADMASIRTRFTKNAEPGVVEKLPHCRIHRQHMRNKKGGNAPDHAFCWQVTESYCNDVMVCCSVCSTWRHASCGGHYKPYSVRECITEGKPFVAICDECHEEQKILEPFPRGKARLERQRTEQLRRALETSAVIRQASFAKHSGTYKWPLGSVSATHIGGHTRSVHSRHDKAEKQWSEMAQKLGRGFGFRPKERSKVRTRELERLLVSVEDAEAYTDRHNMTLFLQNDIRKEIAAGFSKARRNLFDPSDDTTMDIDPAKSYVEPISPSSASREQDGYHHAARNAIGRTAGPHAPHLDTGSVDMSRCARKGCQRKPRFDSMFCSDACGVVALEADLLRSLQYAEDIHPSHLRN